MNTHHEVGMSDSKRIFDIKKGNLHFIYPLCFAFVMSVSNCAFFGKAYAGSKKQYPSSPLQQSSHHKSDLPDTENEGIPCPSGPVYVAEIRAVIGHGSDNLGVDILGSTSIEVCSTDATEFSDVVTHGTPPEGAGVVSTGAKMGVNGVLQIHGRTIQMDTSIYAPLNNEDEIQQCSQSDSGVCVPHAFVASFAGAWVFTPGKWKNVSVGADSAGDPVILMVRISHRTDE